jgi:UDP-N-acetylmuramoyl-L-alanyl-D-glutamate--2,6-diaminopimelate ligase
MRLAEIVKTMKPQTVVGTLDQDITGITCDSRRVMPGNLFVAVPGERTDGHRFVEAAIDRGASAVVLERDAAANPRATRIKVRDARRSMAQASAQFYNHPSQGLKVIGITGTNGKTTTAFMVRAIMEAAGIPCGLLGTVQYQIGQRVIPASRTTPDSVEIQDMMSQMLRAGCGSVSMEVSSHALDQQRVAEVDFDIAIFTNLSQDHLDYHGTMEEYFESKTRLFSALGTVRKAGRAVVNADNAHGRELIKRLGGDHAVLSYGVSSAAIIRAEDVRVSAEGSYFVVHTPQGSIPMSLPLLGRYNVSNALAAIGASHALGIELRTVEAALAQFPPVPGRTEAVAVPESYKVFIDYAHTADALRNVLATISEFTRGRVIVVFGCGGDRDKGKRKPMGEIAGELADFSILTTDNPRTEDPREIVKQIEQGFAAVTCSRYQVIEDRREAIERALDIARPGDAVLIAGKGHETYQEFADTVVPFHDRQVVEEYFQSSGIRWKSCV